MLKVDCWGWQPSFQMLGLITTVQSGRGEEALISLLPCRRTEVVVQTFHRRSTSTTALFSVGSDVNQDRAKNKPWNDFKLCSGVLTDRGCSTAASRVINWKTHGPRVPIHSCHHGDVPSGSWFRWHPIGLQILNNTLSGGGALHNY